MKLTPYFSAAVLALGGAVVLAMPANAQTRDRIQITGSSTVFPFTTTVAERFSQRGGRAPIVESTGTGGGMRLFCAGVGLNTPDLTNASRRITQNEFNTCKTNGVDLVELQIGFDGIVFANAKQGPQVQLTLEQIYLALAAKIPNAQGQLVDNPNRNWSDIAPNLPNARIEVIGPPPTSGTRDSFNEMALLGGCREHAKRRNVQISSRDCQQIRADGAFIEGGENDNIIVQRLVANPTAFGIFGYSNLEENHDKIQGARIGGVEPTVENIQNGKWPMSRSMFVYLKKNHIGIVPGLQDFINEYASEQAMGDDGYLEKKGLVPSPTADRARFRAAVTAATPMAGL
ncbi:substrate-binding domain-containing protein [Phreatobacter sp.]|uniref:substrate-binding domain-containing protein n=1 Tax=Phreatobacter sp. TaxID=1966341 RepID=UPI003F72ED04